MPDLSGHVGIITGAARGMGRAYAAAAASAGAKVVVADIGDAEPVAGEVTEAGGSAIAVQVDVSDEASVGAMVQATIDEFGRIDFLVNNAALYATLGISPFTAITVDDWDRVMAVNLRGPFLCARAVVPHMIEQRNGSIVNISSNTALAGVPFLAHYVSSKGGLIALTRALARELGEHAIRVNTVTPGFTMSDGSRQLFRDAGLPEGDPTINERSIKREQQPEDVVGAVLFLVADDSRFVTGQIINVDGGWLAH
ncbi:MAG TPA: glucose 1-dehydrogenase [Acidimicrobiales bacterium]|jgi:NAD(P)-dependent dehydrogenase (short-subunit alcohol dehydrogenase family)|nr:glucose 1-dehydrogenase [Acidimicrobiales bacterium]